MNQLKKIHESYNIQLKKSQAQPVDLDSAVLLVKEVHDELLVHENFVRQKSGIPNLSLIGNDGVVATTSRKTV